MAFPFSLEFLPTAVGSLPHLDSKCACDLVQNHLRDIPAWPQLPKRNFRESIYAQYSRGFPGVVVEQDRMYVDRTRDLVPELERLYTQYLHSDSDAHALTADYAAGFAQFRNLNFESTRAVKGQVIGPVSWGLVVTDQDRRAILYDEMLAEAIPKHLRLQAMWQERELRRLCPETIIFVDEPYLASFGSAYLQVSRDQAITMLEEVFAGIHGLKGVHCCGNTDWSLLLSTSVDILNFDAYNFSETLALYPSDLRAFLDRGGIIAWGIVPVGDDEQVSRETVDGVTEKLVAAMTRIASKGIPFESLLESALITPACGMGTLSEGGAVRALELLNQVSERMRKHYA
jgi:methionine synthase II (cobalamin-independent)